jgi:hypothetical protein
MLPAASHTLYVIVHRIAQSASAGATTSFSRKSTRKFRDVTYPLLPQGVRSEVNLGGGGEALNNFVKTTPSKVELLAHILCYSLRKSVVAGGRCRLSVRPLPVMERLSLK